MTARPRLARATRLVAGIGTASLLAVTLVWQRTGVGSPSSPMDRHAEEQGVRFLDRYMAPDGRVVRHDQGGDTVSEGQAYAMVVAVGLGDRVRFERAWEWARSRLQRPDGLLAWHWRSGAIIDPMPATDADLDAAVALTEAADRFAEPRYGEEARRLARAILANETATVVGRRHLTAGPWATSRPVYVNPGYIAPASLVTLHGLTADPVWLELDRNGRQLLTTLAAGGDRLPPDWAIVSEDGSVAPAGAPGPSGPGPQYGLEAGRLLVRLAVDCDPQGRSLAAGVWPRLKSSASEGTSLASTLDGAVRLSGSHPTMHVASSAAAFASGDTAAGQRLFTQAVELDRAQPSYFGAAWLAVAARQLARAPIGGCSV